MALGWCGVNKLETLRDTLYLALCEGLTGSNIDVSRVRRKPGTQVRTGSLLDFTVMAHPSGAPDLAVIDMRLAFGGDGPKAEATIDVQSDLVAAALPAHIAAPPWVTQYDESAKQWVATARVEGMRE